MTATRSPRLAATPPPYHTPTSLGPGMVSAAIPARPSPLPPVGPGMVSAAVPARPSSPPHGTPQVAGRLGVNPKSRYVKSTKEKRARAFAQAPPATQPRGTPWDPLAPSSRRVGPRGTPSPPPRAAWDLVGPPRPLLAPRGTRGTPSPPHTAPSHAAPSHTAPSRILSHHNLSHRTLSFWEGTTTTSMTHGLVP